jgi:PAS domain S-box-containing protein
MVSSRILNNGPVNGVCLGQAVPSVSASLLIASIVVLLIVAIAAFWTWRRSRSTAESSPEDAGAVLIPIRGLGLVLAMTLGLLASIILVGVNHYAQRRKGELQLSEFRGRTLVLDERLTMSARLAAATGNTRWEDRYRVAETDLGAVLKESDELLARLLGPAAAEARQGVAATSEYNDALIVLEDKCFELVRAGDREGAMASVMSAEYDRLKELYAQAVARSDSEIERLIGGATARDQQHTSLAGGLGVLAAGVMIGGMVLLARGGRRRLAASARTKSRLAMVAERTSNAVVVTNDRGLIEWVNEGFTRVTGFSAAEVLNKPAIDVLRGSRTDEAEAVRFATAMVNGDRVTAELHNDAKGGREYRVRVELEPLQDRTGRFNGFMLIGTDVDGGQRAWVLGLEYDNR